jgi:hypothetical protein
VHDVLTLKTPHFELTVWTKEVEKPQALLAKTHAARSALLPPGTLRFNPALTVEKVTPQVALPEVIQPVTELTLPEALFFENKQYEFEFLFPNVMSATATPTIIHRLRSVEEGFHYKRGSLRGSVNFGNDIGWFRLGLRYRVAEREVTQYLSFEV